MIQNIQLNSLINFQGRKPKYTDREKGLAMRFAEVGLTLDDAKKILSRNSKLKTLPLYTMEYNIREFVKLLENEGLTVKQHLEAAKNITSLFASIPKTLSNNIDELYNFVSKYGITKKQIIEIQNRNPFLRAMSGKTLVNYLIDILKRYRKSGLKEEEFVPMVFKSGYLLGKNPKSFEESVNTILSHFSDLGMSEKDLIDTLKKQYMILKSSSASVIEKIDLWRYIEENKLADSGEKMKKKEFKDLILRKNLSHSIESNLIYLLRCKLNSYCGTNLPSKKIKEPLIEFLKQNSEKIIEIPVLKGSFVEQFEKVISEFSLKVLNKNIFRVIVK